MATGPASTADHNLFYLNTADLTGAATCTIGCIFGADPLLTNIPNHNFHIQAGSPAIDTGSATGAPSFDFDFGSRPQDGDGNGTAIDDIGADEVGVRGTVGSNVVKLVPKGKPHVDLSVTPLVLGIGEVAEIDLLVQLNSTSDNIYAWEIGYVIELDFTPSPLEFFDAEPETPDFQWALSGDGLALQNKKRLRLPVLGFPNRGEQVRSCAVHAAGRTGDDSLYTFAKGATGDDPTTQVPLQLLDQRQRAEWGDNWCGPTAVGISLAWFAETATGDHADHAKLIPDATGDGIDTGDKYEAIARLGMLMKTKSGDGTTDDNFVHGIHSYIRSVGLTGDFVIKVFNRPRAQDYFHELQTGDEDVLVGINHKNGGGHWLVGRSFSNILNTGGTVDTGDDYYPVSFVDPGTAIVYHSKIRLLGPAIWYSGDWQNFDIMVSVSPTDLSTNDDTAQCFVARNEVSSVHFDGARVKATGDIIVTLLGDPNPASQHHRIGPIRGDGLGRVFAARLRVKGMNNGQATISFTNVKIVPVQAIGNPAPLPNFAFATPCGHNHSWKGVEARRKGGAGGPRETQSRRH